MEEICYFSTVRRLSSFTGWNRIFGGTKTDKKTQHIEIQSGFVAFFGIRDLAQVGGAAENLYNSVIAGPQEITYVAPGNAIFAQKSRVVGAPDGGGPVGRLARVSPNRSSGERPQIIILHAVSASYGVPRRISLGFVHSAAAA